MKTTTDYREEMRQEQLRGLKKWWATATVAERKEQRRCDEEANDLLCAIALGPAGEEAMRQRVIDRASPASLRHRLRELDPLDPEMLRRIRELKEFAQGFWREVQAIGGDVDKRLLA